MTALDSFSPAFSAAKAYESLSLAGKSIPRVIVGTSSRGSVLPEAFVSAAERGRAFDYLDGVADLGFMAFDLAASYQLGGTERLFGSWMRSRKNRERLFLISKGAHPYGILSPNRLTPKAITGDLHASLRRLGTDHIDLYLLHRDAPNAALAPLLACLVEHQRSGKIGAFGVSNWTHTRIGELDALARSRSLPGVCASSPHLSLASWVRAPWSGCVSIAGDANREARAFHTKTQIPVLAWSALGRGFFASRGANPTYDSEINFARRQRVEALARKYEVKETSIALSYLFSQPFPVFAVVASGTVDEMRTNLAATNQRLSSVEVDWLESGDDVLPQKSARKS